MVSGEWRGSRPVVLALHGRSFPGDAEWADYLAVSARALAAAETAVGLAITDGGAPTSRQRLELRRSFAGRNPRGAVLSTSRLARGIGAAIALFNPSVRVYAPRDIFAAARHLGLHEDELQALGDEVARLDAPLRLSSVEEMLSVLRARRRAG
jgi:hypothetical protein